MPGDHVILLSVPGLRARDITEERATMLHGWADAGALAELVPSFPCVTSPVQASMLTGLPPGEHGVIANGFYHRDRRTVEFWVGHHDVVQGEPIWDALRRARPELTSAVWHAQNIKGASADVIVTPAPIHEPDGTTKLWCYSKPDGLYSDLLAALGHFPLQHYWGPLANIKSTQWILDAAFWLHQRQAPNFQYIYVPHLDYAAQKFGPDSPEAAAAVEELDQALEEFAVRLAETETGEDAVFLVAGEYAMTEVTDMVFPNRILRQARLLHVKDVDGREQIDLADSAAFAMVDHQLAHVYVADPTRREEVASLFRGLPGVAGVYVGDERDRVGLNHPRSGEIVLVSTEDRWFQYYWWLSDDRAPAFARTVDIHAKPGYDPVELFFDPATRGIPLNAHLVKGSHGAAATHEHHLAALICSDPDGPVVAGQKYRDVDVKGMVLELMGAEE